MSNMSDKDSIESRVSGTITRFGLIDRGDSVLCAISGGPDSVAMAHILHELSGELGINLTLAHVNYHTRGSDSNAEESLCREIAESLDLDIYVSDVSENILKSLKTGNFQRNAREYRLDFFRSTASEIGVSKIAIGHTRDDVIESSLMHIIRGSGISGLAGIFPRTGEFVRPVIDCTKDELIGYLDSNGIGYRIDKSNTTSDYTRNRVRNELLPLLEREYNPAIGNSISRLAEIARIFSDYLESEIARLWSGIVSRSRLGKIIIDLGRFIEIHEFIRFELLRRAYKQLTADMPDVPSLDYELARSALNLLSAYIGTRADLKNGVMIERGNNQLIVFQDECPPFEREIELPGRIVLPEFNLELESEIVDNESVKAYESDNWAVTLDYDAVERRCVIRNWREGDRVYLLGAPGHRKVSDVFIDRKIPRSLRSEIPMLISCGEILWIGGVGISEKAGIKDKTGKVLKLDARAHVIQDGNTV